MKGSPEEIAKFRRIVDVLEREDITSSRLVMLGLLAMMIDGLSIFHRMTPATSVALAIEHIEKKIRHSGAPS